MMNFNAEEREVTYRYEVWYDGCCLHEESGFDSYEEARDDADLFIESRLDYLGEGNEEDYEIEIEVE